MRTEQEILNLVFRDEAGAELAIVLTEQEILNAVYDESEKALRVNIKGLAELLDGKADNLLLEIQVQIADFTLEEGVQGKIVPMNKSGAGTVTVPTHETWDCPVGTVTGIYNLSEDPVSIAGADGVTVRNAGNIAQYGEISLRKRAENEWVLAGVVS